MKRVAILGSTGSIGESTLKVIESFPDEFRVVGLSANSNIELLARQIQRFKPKLVAVADSSCARKLKSRINGKIKFFSQEEGIADMVQDRSIDQVVLAITGKAALLPLLSAIESKKEIALANKEALVMAGPIIMRRCHKNKVNIIPVDSEQSAIWQCLEGKDKAKLKYIYLTASGGPFRRFSPTALSNISVRQALRHPRWKMGKKITVDSATLMNKGFELFEAMYLFGVSPKTIKILIHPQAIIHSMVEFIDGTILAQLSSTDMRIPIQYALSYPKRFAGKVGGIDFCKLGTLNFERPDFKRFPCLGLAYEAAIEGGTVPCVMNAANEVSVDEFLKERLSFVSIYRVVRRVIGRHKKVKFPTLSDVFEADNWARREARRVVKNLN